MVVFRAVAILEGKILRFLLMLLSAIANAEKIEVTVKGLLQ